MDYLMAAAGLLMLVFGGDILARGSVALALRLSISPLVIGLTVVAFGTSAPELVVSLDAAVLNKTPELALGNVVGSNIANVLLVLGMPALLCTISSPASPLTRDTWIMVGSSALFIALCMTGALTFWAGLVLFTLLVGTMVYATRTARNDPTIIDEELEELDAEELSHQPLSKSVILVVGGLIGLALGAHLLVEGAISVARARGVSEAVIGLTMVAIGTSLPELATVIAAALRHHCDVAIGNVIGSNLFNLLGIMGITAMVTDIPVPASFMSMDLWIMFGTALILVPIAIFRAPINRLTGGVFLSAYVGYIIWVL
jgi:cation:H+ antiporter